MTTSTAEPTVVAPETEAAKVLARSWGVPVAMTVFGLIALVFFGLTAAGGRTTTFGLSTKDDAVQIAPLGVPSQATAIVLSAVCLAIAGYAFWLTRKAIRVPVWLSATFGVAFVLAFLCWAVAGDTISLVGVLQGTLALAVPFIYGALCGMLGERSGVINIAIDGQLLAGAFLSGIVASMASNPWVGLIVSPLAGIFFAWLLAVFTIRYVVNQIIVGVVLNVLVYGLTDFLYGRLLSPYKDTLNSPPTFQPISIPLLSDIPVVGPVLFNQTIVVYLMYLLVALVHVMLFHSKWGLRVRAVGEHPEAADTAGINVNSVRFRQVLLGGAVSGLGGAYYTLVNAGQFTQEMTAGGGFIALAAMIMGRWTPVGALFAALLFGFADNLQNMLNIIRFPIPSELMQMAPYVLTILAVAGLVGRIRPPAANGTPYVKS